MKLCLNLIIFLVFLPFILFLNGCASPVYKYYTPVTVTNAAEPKPCSTPQIQTIKNLNTNVTSVLRERWVEVGYSSWNDEASNIQDDLIKKAKEINACLVLVYRKQTGSQMEEMPIDSYTPSPFFGGGYYGGGYGGYTSYAPYMVSLYQYDILFLTKMELFFTGLYVADLDDKARKLIQSNKGVIVTLVVNGSEAYNADIIPGDIITKIGTQNLTNYESFNHAVQFYRGESAVFNINRAGKKLTKSMNIL